MSTNNKTSLSNEHRQTLSNLLQKYESLHDYDTFMNTHSSKLDQDVKNRIGMDQRVQLLTNAMDAIETILQKDANAVTPIPNQYNARPILNNQHPRAGSQWMPT